MMDIAHDACLRVLFHPSTQNILEALGYEYSESGHADYRKTRPNIVAPLVRAVVTELAQNPIFPTSKVTPKVGLFIEKRGDKYVLVDTERLSEWNEHAFPTAEGAAHGYVRKILDRYWLEPVKFRLGIKGFDFGDIT
jgi:hypothetical protein